MPNLSIRDNANGSGVTLSFAGSIGNSIIIERRIASVSSLGAYVDVTPAMAVTNTEYTITGTDYYYWRVSEFPVDPDNQEIVYQPATAEGDSVQERCLVMIKDRIDAIGLTTPEGVTLTTYIRQMADRTNISYPCIVLACAGDSEEDLGGSLGKDDFGYPVEIIIAEACQADADQHRATHLAWRNEIRKRLNNLRWDLRVPEVWNVRLNLGPIIAIPESEQQQEFRLGGMTAICVARMTRYGS